MSQIESPSRRLAAHARAMSAYQPSPVNCRAAIKLLGGSALVTGGSRTFRRPRPRARHNVTSAAPRRSLLLAAIAAMLLAIEPAPAAA